jgi:hypothetical protein
VICSKNSAWLSPLNGPRPAQDLQVENYAWVNCDDISTGPDGAHYDTAGMVKLGERLAQMMSERIVLPDSS